MLIEKIEDYLVNRREEHTKSGYMFKPSLIHKCPREIYYTIKYPEDMPSFDAKTLRIFDNGTDMHSRYQRYLGDANILLGGWKCKTCFSETKDIMSKSQFKCGCEKAKSVYEEQVFTDDKLNIYGKIDGIAEIGGDKYIIEFKSINLMGFKGLKEPKEDHLMQVHLYFHLTNFDKALIIYENKDNQELKEFYVEKNPVLLRGILNKIEYLKHCVENDIVPDRVCVNQNDFKAKWCSFKELCFNQRIMNEDNLFNRNIKNVDYKSVL